MSIVAPRVPPGTMPGTRFSKFRALLPISPKSGGALSR